MQAIHDFVSEPFMDRRPVPDHHHTSHVDRTHIRKKRSGISALVISNRPIIYIYDHLIGRVDVQIQHLSLNPYGRKFRFIFILEARAVLVLMQFILRTML
jgi:hypothetical protein